jgi:hypothetical protein
MIESDMARVFKLEWSKDGLAVKLSERWQSGVPDFLCVYKGVTSMFELKMATNNATKLQIARMQEMDRHGLRCYVMKLGLKNIGWTLETRRVLDGYPPKHVHGVIGSKPTKAIREMVQYMQWMQREGVEDYVVGIRVGASGVGAGYADIAGNQ